ncbi:MAG TPA: hypothetical protein PKO06_09805, partial [Candidatus Ozemobacteraceae bacterium]|nr:hypothetical protein [Candidatus Ozemobacteraceae bacterium]
RDRFIKVMKIDYTWNPADGTVTREQKPLYLYFLRNPMETRDQPQTEWEGDPSATPGKKVMLHNIADFIFEGYEQKFDYAKPKTENPIAIRKIDGAIANDARRTTFVVVRVHTKIDEKAGDRKDEELDLVAKFYSRVRLADAAYPGYFSQTDEIGAF